MFNCKLCERKFEKVKGLSAHIFWSHNLKSKEYYDLFLKENNEDICENENCNNKTAFYAITKGYRRFCCDICGNTSKIRIEEERERMLKFHKENPEFKENHSIYMKQYYKNPDEKLRASKHGKKLWRDPEIRRKMLTSQRKIWTTEEYRQKKRQISLEISKDPQWRANVSKGTIEGWNKVPEKKKSHSENMKNGGAAYCNMFIKNPSKPQVKLFELCQGLLPYPILNYPSNGYSIDIAVPQLSLAIEYDGTYWHPDKEYDQKRQKDLEEEGWSFLRYIDEVPNKEQLLNDIKEQINE